MLKMKPAIFLLQRSTTGNGEQRKRTGYNCSWNGSIKSFYLQDWAVNNCPWTRLSIKTVDNHRQNMLRKTNTKKYRRAGCLWDQYGIYLKTDFTQSSHVCKTAGILLLTDYAINKIFYRPVRVARQTRSGLSNFFFLSLINDGLLFYYKLFDL